MDSMLQKNQPAQLTGAQRKRLRALANPLKAVVHVGDAGLADGVIRNLDQALEARHRHALSHEQRLLIEPFEK